MALLQSSHVRKAAAKIGWQRSTPGSAHVWLHLRNKSVKAFSEHGPNFPWSLVT